MLSALYHRIEPIFPPVRILRDQYCKLFVTRRYKHLYQIIQKNKCKSIMEIGTWNGNNALQMIKQAKKNHSAYEIDYYGFDLFELLDSKTASEEFALIPPTLNTVKHKLEKTKVSIHLYKGYTKDVFPKVISELPKMDLVFIDGGHSIETIENDWKYTQEVINEGTVVIFDDYWNRDDAGCKKIVENIDRTKFELKVLPIQDKFNQVCGVLTVNLVQVRKRLLNGENTS